MNERFSKIKQEIGRDWPPDLTIYDRRPQLTKEEIEVITEALSQRHAGNKRWLLRNSTPLKRLLRPIDDLLAYVGAWQRVYFTNIKSHLMGEMLRRGSSYWAWSSSDWVEVIGTSSRGISDTLLVPRCRNCLLAFSYVIGFTDLHLCGEAWVRAVAIRVFGEQAIQAATETIQSGVLQLGYADTVLTRQIPHVLCRVMLISRSPRIEDITIEDLKQERENYVSRRTKSNITALSQVLCTLGIIPEALLGAQLRKYNPEKKASDGVSPEWYEWCLRWRRTSTLEPSTRKSTFYCIVKAGRWAMKTNPELSSPEAWTYETAIEYVAALNRSKVGDWSIGNTGCVTKLGQPLSPRAFASSISSLRNFFRDCQEWGWIPIRFSPTRAFRLPTSIRAKITTAPRVIANDIWAKLLWAGLNLTKEDFFKAPIKEGVRPLTRFYPFEMVRAVALVWLFAGLRSNEILRLRVGCVRWQHDEVTVPGAEGVLSKDAICWLDVPVSKTKHAFTKPVDRLVGEAITAWERIRPTQPPSLDPKTSEMVNYLFSKRGIRLGRPYINDHLIPLLCRKAGVPEKDAKGNITSHRARSTIASQLFNSKEPLTLFELQEWLGHRTPNTTQHYAKVNPTKLAKKYADAGYFERNVRTVEVLIDREAVVSGAAAQGTPWQYYDLGHGWCTNAYFVECPHRMACAMCAFYVPKESFKDLLLEGKKNLLRLRQEIPLTEDEMTAVNEGVIAFEQLCGRLADVPTPSGPTPRELVQLKHSKEMDSSQKGQIVKSHIGKQ